MIYVISVILRIACITRSEQLLATLCTHRRFVYLEMNYYVMSLSATKRADPVTYFSAGKIMSTLQGLLRDFAKPRLNKSSDKFEYPSWLMQFHLRYHQPKALLGHSLFQQTSIPLR